MRSLAMGISSHHAASAHIFVSLSRSRHRWLQPWQCFTYFLRFGPEQIACDKEGGGRELRVSWPWGGRGLTLKYSQPCSWGSPTPEWRQHFTGVIHPQIPGVTTVCQLSQHYPDWERYLVMTKNSTVIRAIYNDFSRTNPRPPTRLLNNYLQTPTLLTNKIISDWTCCWADWLSVYLRVLQCDSKASRMKCISVLHRTLVLAALYVPGSLPKTILCLLMQGFLHIFCNWIELPRQINCSLQRLDAGVCSSQRPLEAACSAIVKSN